MYKDISMNDGDEAHQKASDEESHIMESQGDRAPLVEQDICSSGNGVEARIRLVRSAFQRPLLWFLCSFSASLVIAAVLFLVASSQGLSTVHHDHVESSSESNTTTSDGGTTPTSLVPLITDPPVAEPLPMLNHDIPDTQPIATTPPTSNPISVPSAAPSSAATHSHVVASTCSRIEDWDALLQEMASHDSQRCKGVVSVASCNCLNPTQAAHTKDGYFMNLWNDTHSRNVQLLQPYLLPSDLAPEQLPHQEQLHVVPPRLDVLLLGDSITEHWLGTDLNSEEGGIWMDSHQVYQELFQENPRGLALGIGGDRCPQVLYRLQDGEFPESLSVPVVWLTIGTNDMGGDNCNDDAIVAGNIAIINLLLTRQVGRVVVDSLLPRGGGFQTEDNGIAADSVWPMLRRVNERLECYVNSRPQDGRVEFFNATALFLADDDHRNKSLYHDGVHPSALGYRVWGQAIVQRVREILAELAVRKRG